MPLLNNEVDAVIFGKKNIDVIGLRNVDVWTGEKTSFDVQASHYPIEDGSAISDNLDKQPIKITMSGYVSNIVVNIGQSIGVIGTQKQKDFFNQIQRLSDNAEPLTVASTAQVFDNLYITKFTTQEINVNTGTSLTFTLELTQLRIIQSASQSTLTPVQTASKNNPAKDMNSSVAGGLRQSKTLKKSDNDSLLEEMKNYVFPAQKIKKAV